MTYDEAWEREKAKSMAYLQAFAMTQGWRCPICGMINNPHSLICINSWPMQHGTSVEWKHY